MNGIIPKTLISLSLALNYKNGTYHCGYANKGLTGALAAMPPKRISPYVTIEKAVSPPAKLPPYNIQGVPGAVRLPGTPGKVAC